MKDGMMLTIWLVVLLPVILWGENTAMQPIEGKIYELVAQLSEKDPKIAKKAEEELARLGPEQIPLIRKLSPNCTLVIMYDKLTMKPEKGKITQSDCRRAAEEALKYFENLKATEYIVVGLLSDVWNVRGLAIDTLKRVAFRDEASIRAAVKGIVEALEKQPVELNGSENVTVDEIIKRKEIELLSLLTGIKFRTGIYGIMPEDVENVIKRCKEWLKERVKP